MTEPFRFEDDNLPVSKNAPSPQAVFERLQTNREEELR